MRNRDLSQFPLLQGLLHLNCGECGGSGQISLNSHCCRGYCISAGLGVGGWCRVSIPTAAGVTASQVGKSYLMVYVSSQFPLLQGLLHQGGRP